MNRRNKLLVLNDVVGEAFGTEIFSLFLYSLARMHKPQTVVELGTGFGVSAAWMGLAAAENGSGHIWSVDDCSQLQTDYFRDRMLALAKAGFDGFQELGPADYHPCLIETLDLADQVTHVRRTIDLEESAHFDDYPFGDLEVDLLWSDITHGVEQMLMTLTHFLPRMAPSSSIFLDSVPSYMPSYQTLERLIKQLNSGRVPKMMLDWGVDAGFVENREFNLVHLTKVDTGREHQNGTSWIKIEPVDLRPYPAIDIRAR